MTRHLDCPSAPLGEVEPVRLGLVLGDPLGLVLEEGFLDGVVSSAGAELKLVSCRKSDMAAGPVLINITQCCCCFVFKFNLFFGKGDTAPIRLDS